MPLLLIGLMAAQKVSLTFCDIHTSFQGLNWQKLRLPNIVLAVLLLLQQRIIATMI